MKRLFYLLLVMTVLSTGCSKLGDVDVEEIGIKSFRLVNTSTALIELEYKINNPSGRKIILNSGEGLLKKSGTNFARVYLIEADTIIARKESVNTALFRVEILDPLSLLAMGLNVSRWQYNDFRIDVRAILKIAGRGKRTVRFKDIPLENLAKRL
jgi:hypothetical protein